MIISHKYRFLFIGLPFSASSAITKELHEQYAGEPLLRKHSLYNEFKKIATKKELEYFVFAVLRNPMEIVVTVYEKMKNNEKGNFTNPSLFKKNGGHITNSQLKRFNYIHKKNATFQEYFKKFYKMPYDNLASLTIEKCDFVIRYENIKTDYILALKEAGIESPKQLPIANKTVGKKDDLLNYYTKEIQSQAIYVFGPFLKKHKYSFPKKWGQKKVPLSSSVIFYFSGVFKKLIEPYKQKIKTYSMKGTIYGDIQRKHIKKN